MATTTTVDTAFITQFEDDVHHTYQQLGSKLRGTVRTAGNILGNVVRFPKLGTVTVGERTRHGDYARTHPEHTYVEATFSLRGINIPIDDIDQLNTNVTLRAEYVKAAAAAFARETDDYIIDAFSAGTVNHLNAYTGNMDRNKALTAIESLYARNIDNDGMIFCAVTPRTWSHLQAIEEWSSADYVGPELPYTKKGVEVRTWLGVHWMMHTRLPGTGTSQAKCYMWHASSVGHCVQQEVRMDFRPATESFRHHMLGEMSMTAVAIDPDGYVELRVDDSAALPA